MKLVIKQSALACAVLAGSALACGPDFPMELTSYRQETLYGLVEGNFYYEAAQLVDRPKTLLPVDPKMGSMTTAVAENEYRDDARRKLETKGYSAVQIIAFDQARASASAKDALALAASLPKAHQHYIAGAIAFQGRDYAAAREQFQAVIDLGKANNDRLLWAHYMMAQTIYWQDGPTESALAQFTTLRNLATTGLADPHGLALTSLGEQARWHLLQINAAGESTPASTHLLQAIQLYAEQAAIEQQHLELWQREQAQTRGVDHFAGGLSEFAGSGKASLLVMARRLTKNAEELQSTIDQPIVQQLMVSYLFARAPEANGILRIVDGVPEEDAENYEEWAVSHDSAGVDNKFVTSPLIDKLAAAIGNAKPAPRGTDRLAAVLYRAGQFEKAQQFAQSTDTGVAHWVLAKLALRAGDQKRATSEYAKAAKAFPDQASWVEFGSWQNTTGACRVNAESATLALSQGDFVQALQLFHAAGGEFWNDLAIVAERVVSVDELKGFVDQHTKAAPIPTAKLDADGNPTYALPSNDQRLRALLGRRLLRTGKLDAAPAYFDDPALQQAAKRYAQALNLAEKLDGVKKAEALFDAAQLARHSGIDILAAELAPDFNIYAGEYAYDVEVPYTLTMPEEAKRQAQNATVPNKRFSYRYRAIQHTEAAAALVPARSQAYAAMMCEATRWIIYRDENEGARLYQQYLKNGAYVPWGGAFGQACPKPDFARAQAMVDRQQWQQQKRLIKRVLPYAAGGFALLMLLGGYLIWRRRGAK